MDTANKVELLERDAAGNFILDRAAKVILLSALQRGALTEAELDTLNKRADRGGIQIVFSTPRHLPESALCKQGFTALESVCLKCGLASGCTYWQNYGRRLSIHTKDDKQRP